MGVSVSKSDYPGSEDSGGVYIKDDHPPTDIDEHVGFGEPPSETSYFEGESEVIQVLCAEDDDNEDIEWKDIYERLRSNKNLDLQATTKMGRSPDSKERMKAVTGPIFTSSVNKRSTRINSANFNPHAVVFNTDDTISKRPNPLLQENSKDGATADDDKSVSSHHSTQEFGKISPTNLESPLESSEVGMDGYGSPVSSEHTEDKIYTPDGDYEDTISIEMESALKNYSGVSITIEETVDQGNDTHSFNGKIDDSVTQSNKSFDFLSPQYSSASNYSEEDTWDQYDDLDIPRERASSFGSVSIVSVKDFRDELYNEYFYEVRRFIRNFGYFEKFPSPCLLHDAQRTYHQLHLPTPVDDDGRVLPHPPKQTSGAVFGGQDFGEVDERAIFAPENLINKSLGDTAAYLCSGFEDDTQKVRAIYTWLAMRQVTLDNIKKIDKRELCCKMFRKLCRFMQIKTKLVRGIIRGRSYLPGEDLEKFRGCWVSVLVNDTWWLLDPYVTAREESNSVHSSFIKHFTLQQIETEHTHSLESGQKDILSDFDGYFKDPEEFIFSYFPDTDYWQLLARPVSKDEFIDLAVLGDGYFNLRTKLITHERSVVLVEQESVTISLGFPESAQRHFMCNLLYCKGSSFVSETRATEGNSVSLKQYVFLETNLEKCQVNILIQFPHTGSYMLNFYGAGGNGSVPLHICSYRLVYSNPKCSSPFPLIQREEWGPGLDALTLGLTPVSHKTGEIIMDKKVVQVAFKDLRGLKFKYDLCEDGKIVDREDIKLCFLRDNDETIVLIIDMEPSVEGVFTLHLYAKAKANKPFKCFCTYLLRKFEFSSDLTVASKESDKKVKTHLYGYRCAQEPISTEIIKAQDNGRLEMKVDITDVSQLRVELKLQTKQEINFSEHTRHWIKDQTGYIDINFPRAGQYKVRVLGRCTETNHFKTLCEEIVCVQIPSNKWSPFPKVLDEWNSFYKIEGPLSQHLEEKENIKFELAINGAHDVAFLAASGWYHLEHDGAMWTGSVWTGPRSTRARLLARFELGSETFSDLLMFKVMSKEDLETLNERQEIMRNGALSKAMDAI